MAGCCQSGKYALTVCAVDGLGVAEKSLVTTRTREARNGLQRVRPNCRKSPRHRPLDAPRCCWSLSLLIRLHGSIHSKRLPTARRLLALPLQQQIQCRASGFVQSSCADQSNKSAKVVLEPIYEVQIHSNGLVWSSLKHETEHGEVDEGCEGCGMTFKVPHQSSVSADPDEAPLDNPSSWRHDEAAEIATSWPSRSSSNRPLTVGGTPSWRLRAPPPAVK